LWVLLCKENRGHRAGPSLLVNSPRRQITWRDLLPQLVPAVKTGTEATAVAAARLALLEARWSHPVGRSDRQCDAERNTSTVTPSSKLYNNEYRRHFHHCRHRYGSLQTSTGFEGLLDDSPINQLGRGQSSRGLDNSQARQLAEVFDEKIGVG